MNETTVVSENIKLTLYLLNSIVQSIELPIDMYIALHFNHQTNLGLDYLIKDYRHFQQYFSYIMAVSFNGGGDRNTRRKLPTCRKSLTHFIT
jgi:hypothetical protein